MANPNTPRGLVPKMHRNGAPYNGAVRKYYVPSTYDTALYVGDPVIIVTASADANGIQTVARATAGATNYVLGPMVGIVGSDGIPVTRENGIFHPASTAGYILVADDPDLLFEIQEDGVGGAMAAGAAGRNADLIAGTAPNAAGFSGWMLDSNTVATGNTLQLRIVGPSERVDNVIAEDYAKWLVAINLHVMRNLTGI